MQRPIIDFGRLNLLIKAKFHKKSCGRIPCSCWAKIEAWQIHKLWRSLELRICNFLKNYLTTSTICMSERTAFVVFLEKSKVRIPLGFIDDPFKKKDSNMWHSSYHLLILLPEVTFRFCIMTLLGQSPITNCHKSTTWYVNLDLAICSLTSCGVFPLGTTTSWAGSLSECLCKSSN